MNVETKADDKLREYGLMFSKLMESARFRELVSIYFTFTKVVDEETKEIDFQVIENPPSIIAAKMKGETVTEQPAIQVVSGSVAEAVLKKAKESAGGRRHKDPKRR